MPDAEPVKPKASPLSRAEAAAPAPVQDTELPAPISTTLSLQASDLVRWYCEVTRHQESDAIEGAVYGVLSRAREAYAEHSRYDESFNWMLEDVLEAMRDPSRQPGRDAHRGTHTVRLCPEASELLRGYCEAVEEDVTDAANGAVLCIVNCTFHGDCRTFEDSIALATEYRRAEQAPLRQHHTTQTTHLNPQDN